jgi:hypothetical protein
MLFVFDNAQNGLDFFYRNDLAHLSNESGQSLDHPNSFTPGVSVLLSPRTHLRFVSTGVPFGIYIYIKHLRCDDCFEFSGYLMGK